MPESIFSHPIFIFALGAIITVAGLGIAILQLYLISNFNNIRERVTENRQSIENLYELDRTRERECEDKRKELKREIKAV